MKIKNGMINKIKEGKNERKCFTYYKIDYIG